jgi:Ca2+-binding EF-hand superfamily protein
MRITFEGTTEDLASARVRPGPHYHPPGRSHNDGLPAESPGIHLPDLERTAHERPGPEPLSPENRSMLSDVQKKKMTRLFQVIDGDKNGRVEWADYERIATNIAAERGYRAGSGEFKTILDRYQAGWDQAAAFHKQKGMDLATWLDYHNMLAGTPGAYDAMVRPAAEVIFDTFDVDGDKKVTLPEWRRFFRCYGIDEKIADQVFPKLDLNGDGHVSRPELMDLVAQFYMSSDPTAPGNVMFGPT